MAQDESRGLEEGEETVNKVMLMGRLAKDPEIRQTRSGKSTANWVLAVDRPRNPNRPDENAADFIPLVSWERSADFVGKYLAKGTKVLVEGRMQVRSYEAQDGSKRWVTEVVTQVIEFAESKKNSGGENTAWKQAPASSPADGFGGPVSDEEIPF